MNIDFEEVKRFSKPEDKILRLKARLIPIDDILKIARGIIERDGCCLIKNLDEELQKNYIVNSRTKTVYFRFLIHIFQSELINYSEIRYIYRKIIKRKEFTNVLVKK